MSTWLIEPRDPLVVRDGRPNDRRSQSRVLPFPYPETVAGICRTRLGTEAGKGFTAHGQIAQLRATRLRGPCLVDVSGTSPKLLVPAPRDVHWARDPDGGTLRARALHPLDEPDACYDGDLRSGLQPVGMEGGEEIAGKPPADQPEWWTWASMANWLSARSRCLDGGPAEELLDGALTELPTEPRVHVAIDSERSTHRDGMLFGATGLRFAATERRLAIFADFDEAPVQGYQIDAGLGPMGGERRLGRWTGTDWTLPAPPAKIREAVAAGDEARVRVVLLTPACFDAGWEPGPRSPLFDAPDLTIRLRAAAVPPPQVVSGWDFERRGPKPTRRLVPAGAVYWLALRGPSSARQVWLERVWMQNVSDTPQRRNDGYGLAVVGVER